jgi:hypothetical protein
VSGPNVAGLTGITLQTAPDVCRGCVWWQSRPGKHTDKERWIEKAETEWGAWGTVYYDADGRLLGSMQYGPAELFPRAAELPAGPPSSDAVLVTCAYLVDVSSPWVMQSLFLAAIGDERFQVHKTIFPADFLSDFGFVPIRRSGRVELARLDFGGLVPIAEGKREKVLRVVKEAFTPAPVPQRP